jgi:hypothetical protein
MTERNLSELLERAVDRAQVGSAPIEQLVAGAARQRRRRTVTMLAGGCVAVVAVLAGVAAVTSPQSAPSTPPPLSPPSGSHGALTDQEYAAAVRVARQQIRAADATITGATVTASSGKVLDSNTGHACTSGRLLNIKLIGSFPHTVTTGHPVRPGDPPPDFTVRAVLITADAQSGLTCLIGVQTGERGEPQPEPNATVLDIN